MSKTFFVLKQINRQRSMKKVLLFFFATYFVPVLMLAVFSNILLNHVFQICRSLPIFPASNSPNFVLSV